VTTSTTLIDAVNESLADHLADLPTAATARAALAHGGAILASSTDEMIAISDRLAPEHLEVMTTDAPTVASRCTNFGSVFVGSATAEVFGDYGAGPNHVLPTGGTARSTSGLSVMSFLRFPTTLRIDNPDAARAATNDAIALARLEGLEAHARAAALRSAAAGVVSSDDERNGS
jgi:phosphoribosyl-ATP pyrophosphohydrolase/phosphoribosyl-AMP cyclohydrolase/histidinol dehydrogenase